MTSLSMASAYDLGAGGLWGGTGDEALIEIAIVHTHTLLGVVQGLGFGSDLTPRAAHVYVCTNRVSYNSQRMPSDGISTGICSRWDGICRYLLGIQAGY